MPDRPQSGAAPALAEAPPAIFPGRTGAGIRIAVVDSGVHPANPHISARHLAPGAAIARDGSVHLGEGAALDRLGHGTAVTAAIQELAPEAICIPVQVFGDQLRTSATALIAAIGWAAEQGAQIINLSLGSTNAGHAEAFAAAVDAAIACGCTIVTAHASQGLACYPGALPGVIAVEPDWDCPRDRFRTARRGEAPVFLASGYPRAVPGIAPRRNLHGVSFAVSRMSGFAALASEALGVPTERAERAGQVCASLLEHGETRVSRET